MAKLTLREIPATAAPRTIACDAFYDASDIGDVLAALMAAARNHGAEADCIIYIKLADGTVLDHADLQRGWLSDGSVVFNIVLGGSS